MNELIQAAIVYIDLIVTGSEAHNLRKASQGGGNLWIEKDKRNRHFNVRAVIVKLQHSPL